MRVINKIKRLAAKPFNAAANRCRLALNGVETEAGLVINGRVSVTSYGNIHIGKNVRINSGKSYNAIGAGDVCVLKTFRKGSIVIGDNVGLSNCTLVSASRIEIGDNVKIGGGVKVYDTDFHSLDYEKRRDPATDKPVCSPVTIGADAFIGAGSTILKGVTIGECSIIGAGSVVAKDIPAGQIWAGNPAAYIKNI
ncbi:MAG: acyltransferase [Clostridia bacterium]|nr:acyltransferase [Clostridia bacterium]